MTTGRFSLLAGCLLMALAVALGAIGSHVIRQRFDAADQNRYELAVRYGMFHALGLVLLGLAARENPNAAHGVAAVLFLFGIVCFSGALIGGLFVAEPNWIHRLPPYGGTSLILAWLAFAVAMWRSGTPTRG